MLLTLFYPDIQFFFLYFQAWWLSSAFHFKTLIWRKSNLLNSQWFPSMVQSADSPKILKNSITFDLSRSSSSFSNYSFFSIKVVVINIKTVEQEKVENVIVRSMGLKCDSLKCPNRDITFEPPETQTLFLCESRLNLFDQDPNHKHSIFIPGLHWNVLLSNFCIGTPTVRKTSNTLNFTYLDIINQVFP